VSAITRFQRAFINFHQLVYERTDGRLGHRMAVVPSLLLRTVGRRTGQPRTSALVYARVGDEYVVVASNGGADRPPGWLHNVKAQPEVEIQVGRRHIPATARVVERGAPDYEQLWRAVNDGNHHRYESYQQRTERPIPLVALRAR
jgi:deazaflavin-dependent oxidoreductase (nitroreductase family)